MNLLVQSGATGYISSPDKNDPEKHYCRVISEVGDTMIYFEPPGNIMVTRVMFQEARYLIRVCPYCGRVFDKDAPPVLLCDNRNYGSHVRSTKQKKEVAE